MTRVKATVRAWGWVLKKHFPFVALLLVLCGCATARSKSPVFGLYDVPVEAFAEVKKAGFDVVTGAAQAEFLNAAADSKLKVLMTSSAFSGNASKIERELKDFDHHRAAWGWYLIDEPDLHDAPPDRVASVTRSFQSRARKPGVVVLRSGGSAKTYGRDCDLLMVDFYPVPWSPVARFAREMRLASFARDDKPYFGVVQAFDWSHFPEVLGQTNDLRAPTIAEIRCMAYMALALEARGLFFYSFQAGTWNLPASPLWPEVKSLLQELRLTAPLFANAPQWAPSELEYRGPMYNEVHDGVMLSRLYHLARPAKNLPAGYYYLVINTTADTVGYDFRVPFAAESVRHGGETISLDDRWLRRRYEPYEVAIFGPLQKPLFHAAKLNE
jgi:hypothetical protein